VDSWKTYSGFVAQLIGKQVHLLPSVVDWLFNMFSNELCNKATISCSRVHTSQKSTSTYARQIRWRRMALRKCVSIDRLIDPRSTSSRVTMLHSLLYDLSSNKHHISNALLLPVTCKYWYKSWHKYFTRYFGTVFEQWSDL